MCAQYIVDKSGKELARRFDALYKILNEAVGRVAPRSRAPVLVADRGQRTLVTMQFGLVPSWSPEPRVRFATHNARLMSIDEKTHRDVAIYHKPTWRDPFARRHCLVPMTKFVEPIYTGPMAGNMVAFHPRGGDVMAAAGLWDEWVNKESGDMLTTFTVLTDDPVAHIAQMGHDRTPVFLPESRFDQWLAAESKKPAEWIPFLREGRREIDWAEDIDRPLAKGWEKRA